MKIKRFLSIVLCIALAAACLLPVGKASLAAKAKLSVKKLSVSVGAKKTIKLKNKIKKATYSFKSSNKKVCTVNKKGVVTGKAAGTAKVTVNEKYKKKTSKVGVVKVTVTGADGSDGSGSGSGANGSGNANNGTANNGVTGNNGGAANGTNNGASDNNGAANGGSEQNATPTEAPAEPTPEPTPKPTTTPRVLTDTSVPSGISSRKNGVSYGTMSTITYHSDTTGRDRKAVLLLPAGYSTDKEYPVLYLFHGGNGDENDWKSGNPDIVIGNMIANGDIPEMIVVMPNCRARANDGANPSDSLSHDHMDAWTRFLQDFQNDLMPYMADHYSILEGRENTAVGGFSMGGREALYLGFSIPEKIGYMGAFSPAFGLFEYENWGLHEDGYFDENNFTLPDEYFDDTVCLIMNGQNDSMVRNEPERYHNALVKSGFNHFYYTVPGDHNWDVWSNGFYNYLKLVFK